MCSLIHSNLLIVSVYSFSFINNSNFDIGNSPQHFPMISPGFVLYTPLFIPFTEKGWRDWLYQKKHSSFSSFFNYLFPLSYFLVLIFIIAYVNKLLAHFYRWFYSFFSFSSFHYCFNNIVDCSLYVLVSTAFQFIIRFFCFLDQLLSLFLVEICLIFLPLLMFVFSKRKGNVLP